MSLNYGEHNTMDSKMINCVPLRNHLELWKSVVVEKRIQVNLPQNEIAESWQRCLRKNIDPFNGKNSNIETNYLEKTIFSRKLLNIAKPFLVNMYSSMKGLGVVIILTDRVGTIIDIFGDKSMVSRAESVALIKGSSCTEDTMGTTSLGICLYSQKAAQVSLLEHFCQIYHGWNCTAVPIFDHQRQFIGSINVSYDNVELHNKIILGFLELAASAIEKELKYQSLHQVVERSQYYYGKILDNISEPLIVINSEGTVAHINMSASNIYCTSPSNLIGKPVSSIIENTRSFRNGMLCNATCKELNLLTSHGVVKVDSLLRPILNKQSNTVGVVATLREIKYDNNSAKYTFEDYVYKNSKIATLLTKAKNVSLNNTTVLIQGESGTGKELIAQSIHNSSPRKRGPFIVVNCAALPKDLIQSELFGYEDGAYTGARKGGKAGKFELANGGTIFLDEIGDMPLEAQSNLLRVLQEKSVTKIGGSHPIPLDVRVIAATNRNLLEDVDCGHFRHDLYYRLSVVTLSVPPLRERKDDIELLLQRFVHKHAASFNKCDNIIFDKNVMVSLQSYTWPGNIRELENTVIHILNNLKGDIVTTNLIPTNITSSPKLDSEAVISLADVAKETILDALFKCNNNITHTSKKLGISRVTLYKKLKQICPLLNHCL